MEPIQRPARKDSLARQRALGRKVFGVFPGRYPREVFWALNAVPVEIWDPPTGTGRANRHLQPTICSVVKAGLELVLGDAGDLLDGLVFPHTCDSIQNLGSMVRDYLGVDLPCLAFYPPKAPHGPSTFAFLRAGIERLARDLEPVCGPLDPDALGRAVARGRELQEALASLYEMRARGRLGLTNRDFYGLVRSVEFLHPDDAVPLLRGALMEREVAEADPGPGLVLSGVLPGPEGLLSALDDLGVRVAGDDLLACGRRRFTPGPAGGDPLDVLARGLMDLPACSTVNSPLEDRRAALLRTVRACGAGGVLFNVIKFCEPELFYLPALRASLREEDIPSLLLEQEVHVDLSGQARTRVEAFVEMIGSRGG